MFLSCQSCLFYSKCCRLKNSPICRLFAKSNARVTHRYLGHCLFSPFLISYQIIQIMRTWLPLCFLLVFNVLSAQTATNFFKPVPENTITLPESAERKMIPLRYNTYALDYAGIKTALQAAPWEFTPASRQNRCVIAIPTANGAFEEFSVWETAIMEPALAEQAPYIRTFAGVSVQDSRKTVRLSYTLRGFQAMILRPDFGLEYVEPYAWGQDQYYIAYDATDVPESERAIVPADMHLDPSVLEEDTHLYVPPVQDRGTLLEPVKLKVFKFVVSTTGEYGQDHGTTKAEVLSAVVEHTNKVNAIFERDLDIRLQLIQATILVCFFDPNTDPFNGTTPSEWAGQNQAALDGAGIPTAAYDVGHVYARGGGGVKIGTTCTSGKSAGATAGSGAYGNGFIGVICQEVGHQMSAGHTWNRCGGFSPDQRKGGTAFEPGSGSTIMSYAGGCASDNVQNYMDLYFHGGSIEEIRSFIVQGTGVQCGSLVETNNNPPEVTLPYKDNFFIPIMTPFELNGSATDSDGDALTYCWEEMDLGPEAPIEAPFGSAPIFRTFPAVNVSNRYFPKLSTVLNNGFDVTEQLPNITRDMTFRLTARDNRPGGGGVSWADVAFKAWEGAGPFVVLFPNNTTDVWHIGEFANVSWDVAKTDLAPVSCKYVNIRLSTDGGLTYPVTLASHVGNDGSHYVKVPDIPTANARVRIDGEDNVFYDISNKNFKIQAPAQPSFTMGLVNDSGILCLPADHTVEVQTAGVLGYNTPVSLQIVGALPANVSAEWSATSLAPGESATLKLDFSQVDVEDVFTITVRAESGGVTYDREIVLTTLRNDFSALALVAPANGATQVQLVQTIHWTKALDALTYDVQVATSPSFAPGTILASATSTTLDSFKIPTLLAKGTPYFWRVRPANECGVHEWTDPFFFSTYPESCVLREANDLPKNMTSNGKPTIESQVTVNAGGAIKNMEIRQIKGYHEFFKDLTVRLISPQGTEVILWSAKCGNYNGSFNMRLTDDAPGAFPCPPANTGLAYRPQEPLAPFIGQNAAGTWILRASDSDIGGGGAFEAFQLEFCSDVIVDPPYLVNNNPLLVAPGNNKTITPDLLLVEDANNTHSQLQYTLLTVPENGLLTQIGVGTLMPGAQLTQADIDNNELRYFDYGTSTGPDGFYFMVTDGEGGFFGTPKFVIQPFPVGAGEPVVAPFAFNLYPNPANDVVWIAAGQPVSSELPVAVFNTSGQLVQETRLPAGAERLLLHTAGLPRGLYVVQVDGVVRKLVLR